LPAVDCGEVRSIHSLKRTNVGVTTIVNGAIKSEGGMVMDERSTSAKSGKGINVVLWVIQTLLALLFLFSGGVKLAMPIEPMAKQAGLPGTFLRFIAVMEVLGAIGLILPGILRIRTFLTPLAAAGLVIIMIGATVIMFRVNGAVQALTPAVVGVLAAFVAYGRWRLAPLRDRSAG
jgi:uncharacterized membrane protein YphA (DoxX/SURF4 family)